MLQPGFNVVVLPEKIGIFGGPLGVVLALFVLTRMDADAVVEPLTCPKNGIETEKSTTQV
jgi:hypothetical protein